MSINVIERNGSECKYVEIFTHHVDIIMITTIINVIKLPDKRKGLLQSI
jgi:hypothetical protein